MCGISRIVTTGLAMNGTAGFGAVQPRGRLRHAEKKDPRGYQPVRDVFKINCKHPEHRPYFFKMRISCHQIVKVVIVFQVIIKCLFNQ